MAKNGASPTSAHALVLTTRDGSILLEVHVVPRASKTAIVGLHGERLKVTLDAPPVDGAANETLVRFFAQALGRPLRDVTLLRGDKSRQKTLAIRGSSEAEIRALAESACR